MGKMKLVVIESPYSGNVEKNVAYARDAMKDSLHRGEAPLASHLLYTQPGILDDTILEERVLGITAGFTWNAHAELVAVYENLGISNGMQWGIDKANQLGIPVEYRKLKDWVEHGSN